MVTIVLHTKVMIINDTILYQLIGERIKARRIALGKTQSDLASALGMLRTSITNIESGRQKSPLHVLYNLCAFLDIEPQELLPSMVQVTTQAAVVVHVQGNEQDVIVPPKTADFLNELLREE
jgi:transcriptional regulator with XRE-family HTH domain